MSDTEKLPHLIFECELSLVSDVMLLFMFCELDTSCDTEMLDDLELLLSCLCETSETLLLRVRMWESKGTPADKASDTPDASMVGGRRKLHERRSNAL